MNFNKRLKNLFKKNKKQKKPKKLLQQIIKQEKKSFLESTDSSKITKNNTFWKNIQPFFAEKRRTVNQITFVNENEDILCKDKVVAGKINSVFKNGTKSLGINENTDIADNSNDITDLVNEAISKFKNDHKILSIPSKVANERKFSFNEASLSDMKKELRLLNPSKSYTFKNIPPKLINETKNFTA